jgi:quercetin dioxygenase-like cupin family protein
MKSPRFFLVVAVLLVGLVAIPSLRATAQDDPFAGVTVEGLGAVEPAVAPGQALELVRLTFEPGAALDMHHHPGPVIISVVSGEFTTSFAQSAATVKRAGSAEPEAVASGEVLVLNPGDTVAYDADTTGHVMQNNGTEPLVLMASVLFETGQPGFIFEEGTPASAHLHVDQG